MACYILTVLTFAVATIHSVANRAGVREEKEASQERSAREPAFPSARGRDIKDYYANWMRQKLDREMPRKTSGGLASEATATCPDPGSVDGFLRLSRGSDDLDEDKRISIVQINECAAAKNRRFLLKSMEKDSEDRALTEVLLAESFKDAERGVAKSFAHAEVPMNGNSNKKCMIMLMEYADAGTLSSRLGFPATAFLKINEKALIFYEALDGLRALHKRGIVHRNINPNNIFLLTEEFSLNHYIQTDQARRFHPLIGDYSFACCGSSKGCGEVQPGLARKLPLCEKEVVGTLGYISPQVARGDQATPEDDLWSMGKLLLEMLDSDDGMVKPERDEVKRYEDSLKQKGDLKKPAAEKRKFAAMIGLAKHVGSPELADHGLSPKGGKSIWTLLHYLLCNGCQRDGAPDDKKKKNLKDEMTSYALALTKSWLKELGDEVKIEDVPDRDRPKLNEIKTCIEGRSDLAWSFPSTTKPKQGLLKRIYNKVFG